MPTTPEQDLLKKEEEKKPLQAPTGTGNAIQQIQPLPDLNTSSAQPEQKATPTPQWDQITPPEGYEKRQNMSSRDQLMANASTESGKLAPRETFESDAGYEAYLQRAGYQKTQTNQPGQLSQTSSQGGQQTSPPQVDSEISAIEAQSKKYLDELNTLKESGLSAEGEYRDVVMKSAEDRYQAEQANLNRLEDLQARILEERNKAVQAGADIQRQDAENAYNKAKAEYDIQRERTQKAYEDQILDQKENNTKRTLEMESFLAATGGYGSLVKNKEIQDLTLKNDRLINSIVFEKDMADREITVQIDDLTRTYQSNLSKIERDKQDRIQANYDKYLEYITGIQNDREMSIVNKQEAINMAAAEYKRNVAQINQESFNQRYEIAQNTANEVRQIKQKQKEDARAILETVITSYAMSEEELTPQQMAQLVKLEQQAGYPEGIGIAQLQALKQQAVAQNLQLEQFTDDEGNITVVAIDKMTGDIVNQQTLNGLAKKTTGKYQVSYNPITGEQTIFDPDSGAVIASSGFPYSTTGGVKPPAGYQVVGDMAIRDDAFKSIFKVGQNVGLWCGTFASTISTATRVGDSWKEKLNAIDKRNNPKPGDKLLVPLGVRTDDGLSPDEYGHVAVVVNFDPATGDITVVESNKDGKKKSTNDGKGTVTTGIYNIYELQKAYGQNWGFASGDFKPEIKKQLEKAGMPVSEIMPNAMGDVYNEALSKALSSGKDVKEAYAFANAAQKLGFVPDMTTGGGNDAAAGEKLKASFALQARQAETVLDSISLTGQDIAALNDAVNRVDMNNALASDLIAQIKSPAARQLYAARLQFIEAILRPRTGAAIAASEYEAYNNIFFPTPGASKQEVEQKKKARELAIQSLVFESGKASNYYHENVGSIENFDVAPNDNKTYTDRALEASGTKGLINQASNTVNQIGQGVYNFLNDDLGNKQKEAQIIITQLLGNADAETKKIVGQLLQQGLTFDQILEYLNQ